MSYADGHLHQEGYLKMLKLPHQYLLFSQPEYSKDHKYICCVAMEEVGALEDIVLLQLFREQMLNKEWSGEGTKDLIFNCLED